MTDSHDSRGQAAGASSPKARAPYVHPDGEFMSVGFEGGPDSLLRLPMGERDRERIREWAAAVALSLDASPSSSPEASSEDTGGAER